MRHWTSLLILVLVGTLLAGCASHKVKVNAYLDKGPEKFQRGKTIHVLENPDAENLLLQREIAIKIEKLVAKAGFGRNPYEFADYMLTFECGIDAGKVVTGAMFIAPPGSTTSASSYRPTGSRNFAYGVSSTGGYVPYTHKVYGKWLTLKLIEAKPYRESGEVRQVWVGEASEGGRDTDIRKAIDYLLVALFENFGQDTREQLVVPLASNDPRALSLQNR